MTIKLKRLDGAQEFSLGIGYEFYAALEGVIEVSEDVARQVLHIGIYELAPDAPAKKPGRVKEAGLDGA